MLGVLGVRIGLYPQLGQMAGVMCIGRLAQGEVLGPRAALSQTNIRISHSGPKAQYQGDARNQGFKLLVFMGSFWPPLGGVEVNLLYGIKLSSRI